MKRIVLASVIGATVVGTAVGVAVATIPDSGGVIHSCYNKLTGYVRVVNSTTSKAPACLATETALAWNQTGPQGPPGAPGATGQPGPDSAGPSRIHLAFWSVPAGSTTTGFVYCPDSRPVATGGGAQIRDLTDATSNDAQIVASYPMELYGGLEDQADGWMVTVRNQTGRPFNGRAIEFAVYAICAPGAVQIGQ